MSTDPSIGETARSWGRSLPIYFLLDTSGSMADDGKIDAVHEMMVCAMDVIRHVSTNHARGQLVVHVLRFSDDAAWVSPAFEKGVLGEQAEWNHRLVADGQTFVAEAFDLLIASMKTIPNNAFKPVVVFVTDGTPADNFDSALQRLKDIGWGRNSFRLAVAVGDDADLDVCRRWCGAEVRPMEPSEIGKIKNYIRFPSR